MKKLNSQGKDRTEQQLTALKTDRAIVLSISPVDLWWPGESCGIGFQKVTLERQALPLLA